MAILNFITEDTKRFKEIIDNSEFYYFEFNAEFNCFSFEDEFIDNLEIEINKLNVLNDINGHFEGE